MYNLKDKFKSRDEAHNTVSNLLFTFFLFILPPSQVNFFSPITQNLVVIYSGVDYIINIIYAHAVSIVC